MILDAFLLILLIGLSAAFSGMETGIYSVERVRLQIQAASGDRRAQRLLALVADPTRAVCSLLVLNNVVNSLTAAVCGSILDSSLSAEMGPAGIELLNTLVLVPVLFVFGELVPKDLFLRHPLALLPIVQPIQRVGAVIFAPVVWLLLRLTRRLIPAGATGGQDTLFRREALHEVLTRGGEAMQLSDAQRRMAARVLELGRLTARDLMVPTDRIVSVPTDASRAKVLAEGSRSLRSRVLIRSEDGDFDGYLSVLDALFAPDEGFDVRQHRTTLPTVFESTPVSVVLGRLQSRRRPLALVRDEAGSVVGLLGFSDIVAVLLADRKTGDGTLASGGAVV